MVDTMAARKPNRFEARMRIRRLQLQWLRGWFSRPLSPNLIRSTGELIRNRSRKKG
ncbi:MAG: hypothetical protein LUO93_07430 [Methanomicrobiales archaeon]|nr:hypothetical protein [Methanomicrobiales archaeon]